jgi:glycosyltransferase involved in cell wall biosynthesis
MTAVCHRGAAFLLDTSPTVWTSLDEFHYQMSHALFERGIQPVLLYAVEPPLSYQKRMHASGAIIDTLNYKTPKTSYFPAFGKIARKYNVEVIQSRGFNYFTLLWWMARLHGIRRIIFVEGNSGLLRAKSWKRLLLQLRAKALTLPISQTVSVSRFVKDQLVQVGLPAERVVPIHNGVDLRRFHPDPQAREEFRRQYGIQPDELVLATISYLRDFKKPHIVLEACAHLVRQGLPVHLFVAGDGELMDAMKALSSQLGISDKVHWLGNFSQTEKLLQASDVFVLASVGEAFGSALIEAMACGVPCVGSRSGGIPEIIEDGSTGFLATPLDSRDFAQKITQIVSQPELRCKMIRHSLQRAREKFSVERTVADFLRVYQDLGVIGHA